MNSQNGHGVSRQVRTTDHRWRGGNAAGQPREDHHHLLGYLVSSDSEDDTGVRQVRVTDEGSKQQCADVQLEGVPTRRIIDTGSDITIMGKDLFKKVAAVARLRKSQFQRADKTPRTYDGRTFTLDGKIELDVVFDGMTMKTPVYVKVDATEQLLLGEGVCRQLDIVSYHPDVIDPRPHHRRRKGRGDAALTRADTGLNQADNDSRKKARLETPAPKTQGAVEEAPTCTRNDKSVQTSVVED